MADQCPRCRRARPDDRAPGVEDCMCPGGGPITRTGEDLRRHLEERRARRQALEHHADLVAGVVRPWPITNLAGIDGERRMVVVDRCRVSERALGGLGLREWSWLEVENTEYWRGAWAYRLAGADVAVFARAGRISPGPDTGGDRNGAQIGSYGGG